MLYKRGLKTGHFLCTQAKAKKKHNGLLVLASARGYLADVGITAKAAPHVSVGPHMRLPFNPSLHASCCNTTHGMAASDLEEDNIANSRLG